jgi:hypothetical protein
MTLRHKIYLLLPEPVHEAIRRSKVAFRQLRKRDISVERIRGRADGSREPFEALVADKTTTVDYLLRRLFTDRLEHAECLQVSRKSLRQNLRDRNNSDLTIIRGDSRGDHGAADYWRIPDSVTSMIDLDPETADTKLDYGNSDSLRRIKKHRLTATISHNWRELSDFVQNAYVPHIRSRFGDLARPHSELVIARAFKSGGLLWVEQDGVRLAGTVFSTSGRIIRSRVAAPATDPKLAARVHAVSSTKKFLIDYAIERGYKCFDLGRSRPCLLDGVLRHKKRWGARLIDSPGERMEFHMSWPAFTPAIANWLVTTPLVVRDRGGLAGLTALHENESTEACQNRLQRLWSPGLARIIVLTETGRNPGVHEVNGTKVTWQSY